MNKAVYVALGTILGLLTGLAIGVAMVNDNERPETRTAGQNDAESRTPTSAEPLKHDPRARPDNVEVPREEASGADFPDTATPERVVEDAVAAIELVDPPAGDGVISGHITLESGAGVAGVEVVAKAFPPGESSDDTKGDLAEAVRRYIYRNKWQRASLRSAATGADGSYVLKGIDPRLKYTIGTSKPGYEFSYRRYQYGFAAGDRADFRATPVAEVAFEVPMPDGSPAAAAEVDGHTDDRNYHRSMNVSGGSWKGTLKPGTWEFTASSGRFGQYRSDTLVASITHGTGTRNIELRLKARPGVAGELKVPPEFDDEGVFVFLQSDPPSEVPETVTNMHRWLRDFPYDENDWTFRFIDVEPGRYRLLATMEMQVVAWRDVTVDDGLVEVDLTVPAPERSDFIVVRATGPDGEDLDNVRFNLGINEGRGGDGVTVDAVRRPDSTWWIRRREPYGIDDAGRRTAPEEWWYEITAVSPEFGQLTQRFEPDDTHVLEFQFQKPARVTLTVDNHNDHKWHDNLHWSVVKPQAGGQVGHYRIEGDAEDRHANASPFTFGPFQPGDMDIVLTAKIDNQRHQWYRRTVALRSGVNAFSALVPETFPLHVRASSLDGARRLEVLGSGRRFIARARPRDAEDGVISFRHLPAGDYILRTESGEMEVRVPGADVVELDVRPYDCMVISKIKEGGEIESLGLRNGGKVIEVDGETCEDIETFYGHLRLSLSKEDTTWTVIRNNVRTEVSFNGNKLMEMMQNPESGERFDFMPGHVDE